MLQGVKWVNPNELSSFLRGKRIKATKTKNGVIISDKDGEGFSVEEAIQIAEKFEMTYNGKSCIRPTYAKK